MIQTIIWRPSVEEARIEARELHKDLLIDLYNPECGGCRYMEASTYVDPRVSRFVNEFMVPVQYNLAEDPGARRRYHSYWTPCTMLTDVEGDEFRRSYGALDSGRFLAEFWLGLGLRYLHASHPNKAAEVLSEALDHTSATPEKHAENLYWLGCARYNAGEDISELEEAWRELRMAHPDSEWTKKCDFLFVLPDGV